MKPVCEGAGITPVMGGQSVGQLPLCKRRRYQNRGPDCPRLTIPLQSSFSLLKFLPRYILRPVYRSWLIRMCSRYHTFFVSLLATLDLQTPIIELLPKLRLQIMADNGSNSRIIWKLHDLDTWRDPALIALASRNIAHLSVEFLHTNGVKPHVVFNLKPNALPRPPASNYKGVRLLMEWYGYDELDTGTFDIRPLPYINSSMSAIGAFEFPLWNKNITIRDWCQILRGRYQGLPARHTSDLTCFRFAVSPSGKMDGCRDFM